MLLSLYFSIIFRIFSEWFFHFSHSFDCIKFVQQNCSDFHFAFNSSIWVDCHQFPQKKEIPMMNANWNCVWERERKNELYWLENDLNRNRKELTVSLEELEYGSRQIYKMLNVCATERPCRMCSALTNPSRTRYVCVCVRASEWVSWCIIYSVWIDRMASSVRWHCLHSRNQTFSIESIEMGGFE